MRLGYYSLNSAEGIRPDVLAKELEDRGFDSVWLPQHSHIPVVRQPVEPWGETVPDSYIHIMDPFVSLAIAAGATTNLLLGTGVSMVLEHDLLDLACRLATLDVLCGGRLRYGIGFGWLTEELANHRPDVPFSSRQAAVAERVRALRMIWSDDEPAFEGRWEKFDRSWVFPKPVQHPLPIGFGTTGEIGMRYAAALADEWYPIDAAFFDRDGGVAAAIEKFKELVARANRDPESVPITLFAWGFEPGTPSIELVASYEQLGVERVVVATPTLERHPAGDTLRRLDEFSSLVQSRSPS
jgi:probable F420-dependent oxidoreductase